MPLLFPDTLTQLSAWIRGALDEAVVFRHGGCCSFNGCCTSCVSSIVVWWVCSLKCWPLLKLIPLVSAVCCAGDAYSCGYGWAAGLGRAGVSAGAFCGRPASCCSFVIPTLILLHSSARKPTLLVVETCFSTRAMI